MDTERVNMESELAPFPKASLHRPTQDQIDDVANERIVAHGHTTLGPELIEAVGRRMTQGQPDGLERVRRHDARAIVFAATLTAKQQQEIGEPLDLDGVMEYLADHGLVAVDALCGQIKAEYPGARAPGMDAAVENEACERLADRMNTMIAMRGVTHWQALMGLA